MDRNNYKQRTCILLFILVAQISFAQSIILRPYYGRKWYWSNSNNIVKGNFDPSFSNEIKASKYITGVAVELQYPKNSFEVYFSSIPTLLKFQSYHALAGYRLISNTEGAILQFQFLYNHYINFYKNKEKKYRFLPVASAGFGLGIIPAQSILDNNNFSDGYLAPNGEYIEVEIRSKRPGSFNLSGIFKLGVAFKKREKEFFRLQAIANIGLNMAEVNEINYSQTEKKYAGTIISRGTFIGLQLSVPIYLKRFKKK